MLAPLMLVVGVQITSTPERIERLRTTEPVVQAAIDEGRRRSPTFASLVDAIERSDTIVYVTRAHMLPHRMDGCLTPSRTRSRYLRVLVASGLGKERTIVVLAHEFQHVREVLEAGSGTDQAAFDSLFTRIGEAKLDFPRNRYETTAAQEVMEIVAREMRASGR